MKKLIPVFCIFIFSIHTAISQFTFTNKLYFMQLDDAGQISWCSIDPQTEEMNIIETFDSESVITEPALYNDGEIVVFSKKHATSPELLGEIDGKEFSMPFPENMDIEVRHPSISHDGKLLAFTIKSSKHVGNVDVYDMSGVYDDTYTAVGSWYKIVSVNLETGKQQAVYHDDALLPDVMKMRGLGPVFSPAEDKLAYADNYRIYVCDAYSGKNLNTFEAPTISSGGWTGQALVSEYSGMAFSPDGTMVCYLSQGEADIAVSPCWFIFLNINTGESMFYEMPGEISAGAPYGQYCFDFSPDGQFLVFSAVTGDLNQPFLCLLSISSGEIGYIEKAGRAFHPVWKGR